MNDETNSAKLNPAKLDKALYRSKNAGDNSARSPHPSTTTNDSDRGPKPTWQEIQEKKINMVKERGSRVLKINSPLGSTMFNILRQFDMAYAHFKARLGEMDGISHEEGEKLMTEGREIVVAFSDYTARLSRRIRFRYFVPRELKEFMAEEEAANGAGD